eukprot:Stramenopile-MAST_4_protein_2588
MFSNRHALSQLQAEYERGARSAASLKMEAQRIVKENLAHMKVAQVPINSKRTSDGKEEFDVSAALRQVWCQLQSDSWGCLASIRAAPQDVVEIYFRTTDEKQAWLYTIGFLTRDFAFRFLKAFCSEVSADPSSLSVNQPIDGSLGIDVMSLSQSDNEGMKFRVIEKSAYATRQKRLREVLLPRVQKYVRMRRCKNVLDEQRRARQVIVRAMLRFWGARTQETGQTDQSRTKKKKKLKKKGKLMRRRMATRLQAWYRSRVVQRRRASYCAFGRDMEQYVSSVDFFVAKLRTHYDEIIARVTSAVRRVRPHAVANVFGSYANGLFTHHSDLDIVVSFHSRPFFEDASFRMAVPRSVRNVGAPIAVANADRSKSGIPSRFISFGPMDISTEDVVDRRCATVPAADPLVDVVSELAQCDFVRSLKFIQNSRIPIIKMTASSVRGVPANVDISTATDAHGGLRALSFVSQMIMNNPALRPLVLVLKQYLMEHKLLNVNDSSGGLTSYGLFVLATRCLGETGRLGVRAKQTIHHWADILTEFFHLYGNDVDFGTTGVAVECLYSLELAGILYTGPCVIDDPVSPGKICGRPGNLGQNTFRIVEVQHCFQRGAALMSTLQWRNREGTNDGLRRLLRIQYRDTSETEEESQGYRELAWPKNSMSGMWKCNGETQSELVRNLCNNLILKSELAIKAMKRTDRRFYVPERFQQQAYMDQPLPLGHGAAIGAPHMHAFSLEFLAPHITATSNILDVGSGSGYLTACLSRMAPRGSVVGIDHIEALVEDALDSVRADDPSLLENDRLQFKVVDGFQGYEPLAPYDLIHVGAAANEIPEKLCQQLAPGGRMVIPIGPEDGLQEIFLIDKDVDGYIHRQPTMGVRYVPLTSKTKQNARS